MAIHSVFIFLKTGETLVSVTSPMVRLDQTLLTGLLTAIREFGQEAIAEEVRTVEAGNYRFHYDVLGPLITVGLADADEDELEVQGVLHSLNVLFHNQYEHLIHRWDGSPKAFRSFIPIIHEALEAHNRRAQEAKRRVTSTEYLLSILGEVLDTVLLCLLARRAVIFTGDDNTIRKIGAALDQLLPFPVPRMTGISDASIAQEILQSRESQIRKVPTLLGVTADVYRRLTVPHNLSQHLFVKLTPNGPLHFSPFKQHTINLAEQALNLASNPSIQARLLEFELDTLTSQLNALIQLRRLARHLPVRELRHLLHVDAQRFRLLSFLVREAHLEVEEEEETSRPTSKQPKQPSAEERGSNPTTHSRSPEPPEQPEMELPDEDEEIGEAEDS